MSKKILMFAMAALLSVGSVWAVPAKQGLLHVTQPDGTVISIRKIGDERSHVTLSPEGYPVSRNADGFYCYADFAENGVLEATSVKVKALSELSVADREIVSRIDLSKIDNLLETRAAAYAPAQAVTSRAGGRIGLMDDAFFGYKELKGLVILAQYQDVKFAETSDREFFVEMLNREGFDLYDATGSARDYFINSSSGQFIPEFDVYGPVTLPQPMAFYGGNDEHGNDLNAAQMIFDACKGLDDQIDFSEYDIDGDGYVDNVFVFYAGYGEATYGTEDSVWPHQWSLSAGKLNLKLDGVYINKYACSNELELDNRRRPRPVGIGTFVHEFSHVLGLPDLYVTSGSGYWTPVHGACLTRPYNNNGRTPPVYSIYERYSLGWIDPVVLDGPDSIVLDAISATNQGCIIPTSNDNEFFLLENRQQIDWDKYIPGHGMLIWHIDYNTTIWTRNYVNNQVDHNYVDIEEACGTWHSPNKFTSMEAYTKALGDYAFPGSGGVTSFTDETNPSMKTWSGRKLGLPVTDIEENDGLISFNVAGGRCEASVPVVKAPVELGDNWFTAAWNPADGAVGYKLSVQAFVGEGIRSSETSDFGVATDAVAVMPQGWELISNKGEVYAVEGNYGQSAPSLKLTKTGSGFMTATYDTDIASVEFWMRGVSTNSKSAVLVEGLVGDRWVSVGSFTPTREYGVVYKSEEMPEGVRRLRFIYNKSIGNVAIDDVVVSFGESGFVTLPDYDRIDVGNVTSFRVDRLREDVDQYVYSVCAVDVNGRVSAWSDQQAVTLGGGAGIDDVVTDSCIDVAVDGMTVNYTGVAGDRLVMCDLCGRIIETAVVGAGGSAVVTAPAKGLYILSVAGKTMKIVVR